MSSPPSSFFPFQAYAGNPDPGMPIPREFARPVAPFMAQQRSAESLPSLYKQSAAAAIPRSSSAQSFRAPFLSPSSRPSSSLWSPPSLPQLSLPKSKPPLPSTALTQPPDKPWLKRTQPGSLSSYLLTLSFIILGTIAAGLLSFIGYATVPLLDDKHLCLVLNEQFSSSSLDESIWNYDVQFDNLKDAFQITTKFPENIYLSNSNLYIVPTLSSSRIQDDSFSLSDCTAQDPSLCSSSIIPPIMSARIHTKSKKSIRFGRIAIRAKLPIGDWLHPRIYLLPESDSYGPSPASGRIDLLNARGNGPTYDAQGGNFVRASLAYGPLPIVQNDIFGWVARKRGGLWGSQFHDFVLEWDSSFIRAHVDRRTQAMLEIPIGPVNPANPFASPSSFYFSSNPTASKPSFWSKADFPPTVHNSTSPSATEIVLPNPYQNASDAAPFDQKFYLVVDLGVGGTAGWFPDGIGGKPWLDGEGGEGAMKSFARDQARWLRTWPEVGGTKERAFRIDYIKMWEKC